METSDTEKRGPGRPKVERKETLAEFEMRLDDALRSKEHPSDEVWLETTAENIQYFNRRGLGGAEYFLYKGVKVCEYGKMDALMDKDSDPVPGVNFVTVLSTGTEPKPAAEAPASTESA